MQIQAYITRLAGTEALDFYPAMASRLYTTYSMLSKKSKTVMARSMAQAKHRSFFDAAWRRGRLSLWGATEEEKKGPLPGRNWGDTLSFRQRKNGRDDQERNVFFFFFSSSSFSPLSLALMDRPGTSSSTTDERAQLNRHPP